MASKKGRHLAERAAATTRQPQPARLAAEQARKPGYRVVPVRGYPGIGKSCKLLFFQEVRRTHSHKDMPRCVSPTPPT